MILNYLRVKSPIIQIIEDFQAFLPNE